jgi:hypothetical protein
MNKHFIKLIERIIGDWLIRRYLPWLNTPAGVVIAVIIAVLIGFIGFII